LTCIRTVGPGVNYYGFSSTNIVTEIADLAYHNSTNKLNANN